MQQELKALMSSITIMLIVAIIFGGIGFFIGGKVIAGPKTKLLVIPREDGDIVFRFTAVTDDSKFDIVAPRPKPPRSFRVGVGTVEKFDDPAFLQALERRDSWRTDWFFLESIRPSNIEWATVDYANPDTWKNWRTDLKEAGFSVPEVNLVFSAFVETNMINDEMLKEARDRFLASQVVEAPPG